MKILFITNLYPPVVFGGYERLCFDVASAFRKIDHSVIVLTSSFGSAPPVHFDHQVKRDLFLFATEGNIYTKFNCSDSERRHLSFENVRVFQECVDEMKPDVIFVWNLYFLNAELIEAIEKTNVKKCYLLTDNWLIAQMQPDFLNTYFRNETNVNIKDFNSKEKLLIQTRNLVGKAIFPSEFMRNLYHDSGFRFKQGSVVCHHGVNLSNPRDSIRASRNGSKLSNCIKLLFAGRVVEIKGVHTAIEALKKIKKSININQNVLLTIVGDVSDKIYYDRLQEIVLKEGLSGCVEFKNAVREEELFDLFQQYDIYLFPSLYEPFSLTLIHALWSGIPIVASRCGGTPEIIIDNETGLLFEAGDSTSLAKCVLRLVVDSELRDKISKKAVAISKELSFDKMIKSISKEVAN